MNELIRMLLVFSVTVILMILSINLSTYAKTSKILKEDLEIAVHDASLQVDSQALSNGYIVFNQEKALDTFVETLEINTGMVEGDDYNIVESHFFDHHNSTQPSAFACENSEATPYEFTADNVNASYTVTCPTMLVIIQHTADNFFYLAGESTEEKDIIKGAAYSYELDPDVFSEEGGLINLMAAEDMETMNNILNMSVAKDGDYYWPVPYTKNVTSHFQPNRVNPVTGKIRDHNGTDIAANGVENEPTIAIADGTVTYAGTAGGYGNVVEINHGDGLVTRYAHLNSILVSSGDVISGGDVIGLIGSTGNSTAPHLHFETILNGKTVNPLHFY